MGSNPAHESGNPIFQAAGLEEMRMTLDRTCFGKMVHGPFLMDHKHVMSGKMGMAGKFGKACFDVLKLGPGKQLCIYSVMKYVFGYLTDKQVRFKAPMM